MEQVTFDPGVEDAMNMDDARKQGRRRFLEAVLAGSAGLAVGLPQFARCADGANASLKIGVIGSGRIG